MKLAVKGDPDRTAGLIRYRLDVDSFDQAAGLLRQGSQGRPVSADGAGQILLQGRDSLGVALRRPRVKLDGWLGFRIHCGERRTQLGQFSLERSQLFADHLGHGRAGKEGIDTTVDRALKLGETFDDGCAAISA